MPTQVSADLRLNVCWNIFRHCPARAVEGGDSDLCSNAFEAEARQSYSPDRAGGEDVQ